ncbi:SDR family oxidoreductase [Pseudoduganella violacea]|uniref:NAD(P)H dehydrogenase (Quinone) n=1 Tax=Pseudoduganella violacea TaxID=1715466 RepID=A0A7W5B8D5_9BURK|nr:SDR family oxidoreductase [Pseudoduganella violacea]MBB3118323.1 NAD(P)H dehydrogenase (quinone) [Pseudoduganella violacea]
MIVITGASGQLGQLVISSLLKTLPASGIAAVVRDPAKAGALSAQGVQLRQADYNDPASLDAAFQGADKILLISSSEVGQRLPQHRNAVEAAKRAQPKLLAYTSVLHADTSPLGLAGEHKATEELIRASGLNYTILRNGWYFENYHNSIVGGPAHGVVLGSAGEGRIAAAARADYADAAVAVLTAEEPPQAIYELGGDHPFTMAELAAEIARQSGQPVAYQNLPQAEYKAALLGWGLPEGLASLIADSDIGASQGGLDDRSRSLSQLIGRPTQTLSDAVKAALTA